MRKNGKIAPAHYFKLPGIFAATRSRSLLSAGAGSAGQSKSKEEMQRTHTAGPYPSLVIIA